MVVYLICTGRRYYIFSKLARKLKANHHLHFLDQLQQPPFSQEPYYVFNLDFSRRGLGHRHGRLRHRNPPRAAPPEVLPGRRPSDPSPLHLLSLRGEEAIQEEEEESALREGRRRPGREQRGVPAAARPRKQRRWLFRKFGAEEGAEREGNQGNAGEPCGALQRNSQGSVGSPPAGLLLLTLPPYMLVYNP